MNIAANAPGATGLPPSRADEELDHIRAALGVLRDRMEDAVTRLDHALAEHRALLRDILSDMNRRPA